MAYHKANPLKSVGNLLINAEREGSEFMQKRMVTLLTQSILI